MLFINTLNGCFGICNGVRKVLVMGTFLPLFSSYCRKYYSLNLFLFLNIGGIYSVQTFIIYFIW